jgi:hypothetical protein
MVKASKILNQLMNTLLTSFTLQVNLENLIMNLKFQKLRKYFIKVK